VAAMPIQYRVDAGPMSKTSSGAVVIDNAAGLRRVQAMFDNWQKAPNTSLSFRYAGPLLQYGSFAGGSIATVADYNATQGACKAGLESPIMFDSNGSITQDLGLPEDIIGFAGICKMDAQAGHVMSAFALLNGRFQNGINTSSDYELTATQFDEAITHEIGHFLGLDHSEINGPVNGTCLAVMRAELPLMYPVAICPARTDSGLPILAPDDQAWIAKLYPGPTFEQAYGTIRGVVYFSDGVSQAQGVNVIARLVDDPATPDDESYRVAVSVVSGFRFTGNPGQDVTGDNKGGSLTGSRDPSLIGYYEIPVPPGTYTVFVENISSNFRGGSSVGPLDPPMWIQGIEEFWNKAESPFDDDLDKDPVKVDAGQTVDHIDIILNNTPYRFDDLEDGAFLVPLRNKLDLVSSRSNG
jgi:hypothetical protein